MERPAEEELSTFCVMPFSHLFANEVGEMHFCCMAVEGDKPISAPNGSAYSLKDPSQLKEAWNSVDMRRARLELLSGARPPACTRCFKFEDNGIRSYRQYMNSTYGDLIPQLIEQTRYDGRLEFDPYSVDVRLGNICNLKCRMCSPKSSKALLDEWRAVYPEHGESYYQSLEHVNWFQNEAYWDILFKHIGSIRNFHFAGGEPLLIREMYVFLKRIIATGRAPEISISYNTNATLIPLDIYELWPHFKAINLVLSIDGTEKVNSYIRHPSNWAKVSQNIETFDAHAERLNIKHMRINTTVQAYNVFDLPDFLKLVIPKYKNVGYPMLSLLFNPDFLSIQAMPIELRIKAADRLSHFHSSFAAEIANFERFAGEAKQLNGEIQAVVDFARQTTDPNAMALTEFVRNTRAFDLSRKQNLAQIVPEFAPYFESTAGSLRADSGERKTQQNIVNSIA